MSNQQQTEYLFSYGTLQKHSVQLATFERLLDSMPDRLFGYQLSEVKITAPTAIHLSGTDEHPILIRSINPMTVIEGTVFQITQDELARADEYEDVAYNRQMVTLESGIIAWTYTNNGENI